MRLHVVGLSFVLVGIGCGGESDPPPDFEVTLASSAVSVITGSTASVEVIVDRDPAGAGAVAGDLTISVDGTPSGVAVDPLVIPGTVTEGTLTIRANELAPHVVPASLTVRAVLGDVEHTVPLALTVRGAAGTLDTTFGTGGLARIAPATGPFLAGNGNAAAIDSAGRMLIAGSVGGDIAAARFLPSGIADTTFGADGIGSVDCGLGGDDAGYAIALDPSGNIVVAGAAAFVGSGFVDLCVVRFRATDGAPDPSFGAGGVHREDAGGLDTEYFHAVAALADGSLVAMGFRDVGPVGRLVSADGQGSQDVTPDGESSDDVVALADGGYITLSHTGETYVLTKVLAGGALDPAFGSGGAAGLLLVGFGTPKGLSLQRDGKIVIGVGGANTRAVRFSTTGVPDSWGQPFGDGMLVHQVEASDDHAFAIGATLVDSAYYPTLVRLTPAFGELDPTFGVSGYATILTPSPGTAGGVVVQPDGRIVHLGAMGAGPYAMRFWP
jgi:uncharacterized delta-60 repeat protein